LSEIDRFLSVIPGTMALQIGGPCNLRLLQKCKMNYVYYCSDQAARRGDGTRLQCRFDLLPFESNSVNLVLIAHALEFATKPQLLLQEVYRILKPGGQILILGFNRWSYWSLVRSHRGQKGYPWSGCFHSIWRIKNWLSDMGYGVISNKSFCFIGPSKKRKSDRFIQFAEVMGQVFIPKMGAIHLIYAQKKVAGMTPLASVWHKKTVKARPVTVRSIT